MEIITNEFFLMQLQKCPVEFISQFGKIFLQLEIVDKPTDIKNIYTTGSKGFYKLKLQDARVGLFWDGKVLKIVCFLYNPFF